MAFARYADYYDIIYRRKNYRRECRYLQGLFQTHASKGVKSILDLGCGTAGHLIPFAREGYQVTGVDASAPMLRQARAKVLKDGLKAQLVRGKLQSFNLKKKFDAVLCLFSVIDYLVQTRDLNQFLKNVNRHMKPSSLFIFDFWNQSAVERYYSPLKRTVFTAGGKILERRSKTRIDTSRRLCEVDYTCELKEKRRVVHRDHEKHVLRYFSIGEMAGLLEASGLTMLQAHPFLRPSGRVRGDTWDVTIVARRK